MPFWKVIVLIIVILSFIWQFLYDTEVEKRRPSK